MKKRYTEVRPRIYTTITDTRNRSRKSLRSMTSDREEGDYLFFKKYFLNTGMLLTLQ
jgi:hypothetical protein